VTGEGRPEVKVEICLYIKGRADESKGVTGYGVGSNIEEEER